jgi:hypothetical protein
MQYTHSYDDDFATIDRVDNSIGHVKSNCVIACRQCNCSNGRYLSPKWKTVSFMNKISC